MAERGSVGFADIEAAAERLAGLAVVTPVLENATLNEAVGARVLIKPECLQRTGSFKFRGAYNRISQLTADELARGVVAWSSGNHAQGVAAAARLLGTPATIVMPHDAPRTKLERTLAYGAEVVGFDRFSEDREVIARAIADRTGAALVPSYDHVDVIAGQGTCGLEFAHQLADREVQLESLLVCCGGGGLISGIATAFQSVSPDTRIYAVEPEEFDDTARSLKSGERVGNAAEARSICDALLADRPGVITFAINQRLLAGALTVSDQEVQDAMRFSFEHLKLVVEPGGAVALAAALAGKLDISGATVGIIISGGNVDAELFASTIATRRNRSGSI
jgi:threonine dehydratase